MDGEEAKRQQMEIVSKHVIEDLQARLEKTVAERAAHRALVERVGDVLDEVHEAALGGIARANAVSDLDDRSAAQAVAYEFNNRVEHIRAALAASKGALGDG